MRLGLRSLVSAGCLIAAHLLASPGSVAAGLPPAPDDSLGYGPSVNPGDPSRFFLRATLPERARPGARAFSGSPGTDVPLGGWMEPAIAMSPIDPMNIAYASSFELRVSTDGGTTWENPVPIKVPVTYIQMGDPSVAFDRDGRLFWCYQGAPVTAYVTFSGFDVFVAQCDPATGTVLPGYPINVTDQIGFPASAGNLHDKVWLAADFHASSPFANRLYVAWSYLPNGGGSGVYASHSSDFGLTWSPALALGAVGTIGGVEFRWPAHVATAPNGDVYVAYHRQPTFSGSAPNGVSGLIEVYRSEDGGESFPQNTQAFTAGQADMTFNVQSSVAPIPGARFLLQGSVQPWVLADPNVAGRIWVVANDDPDNDVTSGDAADVFIARSEDFGMTWDPPARVDHGPGTTFQVMPAASIDPVSGAIVVHFYDNRNGALNPQGRYLLDVFATVSLDGGATFGPDFQVNDTPFDPDAGARCRFNCGPLLTDVWTSGTKAFAVSTSGPFLSYDGSAWSLIPTAATPKFGVWGSSNTNVFMCGGSGDIRRYNGSTVSVQASNTTHDLFGIDGRSGSDVFAVGAGGTVVHYNGVAWSVLPTGSVEELHDVWANPTGGTFVVGTNGTVLRYDGSWTDISIGTAVRLWGVWGTSDTDVYATGTSDSTFFHWDGSSWSVIPAGLAALSGVWGSSASDIIVLGFGRLQRYDGSAFSSEAVTEHLYWKLHGSGPADVFVVGEEATILHYDGSIWTLQTNPLSPTNPTKRVGEYNGVAAGGGRSFVVWCGNQATGTPGLLKQQSIFDSFQTDWNVTEVSLVDLSHRSTQLVLERPAPNPASHAVTVAFSLPAAAAVELSLVDASGRRVATLIHGQQPAGRHVLSWNGRDAAGRDLAAGIYFLHLNAGPETSSQRVTLVH